MKYINRFWKIVLIYKIPVSIILVIFSTLYFFCIQTVEPNLGILTVHLEWNVSVLSKACSDPASMEIESSPFHVIKNNVKTHHSIQNIFDTKRTLSSKPASSATKETSAADQIRLTLQPGDLVSMFDASDTTLTIEADLGIYNIAVEILDEEEIVLYSGSAQKILVESFKTTEITVQMEPNFPSVSPEFIGLSYVNLNTTGEYQIQWTSCDKASQYRLEEDQDSTFASSSMVYEGPDTTHIITNQSEGTYYYRVRGENDINISPWSSRVAFQVQFGEALFIQTDSLSRGTVGINYEATLSAIGGTAPYTWSLSSGSLPAGLSLDAVTGVISGTPTTVGMSSFTIQVSDNGTLPQTDTQELSITIYPILLEITTISPLPDGMEGISFSQIIDAQGGSGDWTWSMIDGSLPAGINFIDGSECGRIEGTPTETGTFNFTVQVIDNVYPELNDTKEFSLTINTFSLIITTTSLPDGQVGTVYSQTVNATGGTTPYTWSISSGTLPAGLSINASTGVISGTPTTTGTSNFTVQVTDSDSPPLTDTRTLSITIHSLTLTIATTSLPDGQVGVVYSQTVTATGGTTPYTWSISSGTLPAGLSIDVSTGMINGTPTATGTSNFTVQITDNSSPSQTDTQALSITINPPILTITTTSLPDGQVDVAYNQTVNATGGTTPYTWSISSGTLPAGLSINASTGVISGTPTTVETSDFTVQVTDAGEQTDTRSLFITIHAEGLFITSNALTDGQVGQSYNQTLSATGGTSPYTWSISSGSLPSGLDLNTSTGVISGTPTSAGTSGFTVQVTDNGSPPQTDTQALSITIHPPTLTITTTSLASGTVGQYYSRTVSVTGGTTPYTWSISSGTLPAGLSINASTGVISGTPTSAGTSGFTVQVTDNGSPPQTDTQVLSITINPSTLTITTTSLLDGQVGTAYSQTVNATGGTTPYTWSISSGTLPAELSINASTSMISGTPTSAGTSGFTVQVTDNSSPLQTDTQALSITINPPILTITTTSLPDGQVGIAYSQTVNATGGTTPYTWSVSAGSLPAGLNLNTSTGVISGTPATAGISNFTIRVDDSGGQNDTQALSITINPSTLNITTTSLTDGQVGTAYSQTVFATGGTTPYSWSISSGTLPYGLSINASTGVISGTSTASDSWTFTVQVSDNGSPPQIDTQELTIDIYPADLEITTGSPLPDYKAGTDYNQQIEASGGTLHYTWTLTNRSPLGFAEGLNLSTDGILSGNINIQPETGQLTIQVTDNGSPPQTDTKIFDLTITVGDLALLNAVLPDGQVGDEYWGYICYRYGTSPLESPWTITGDWPLGVTQSYTGSNYQLNLGGWPIDAGTFYFTVTIRDSGSPQQTRTDSYSITINP